jgi:large subunit ribosomal protein L25
LELFELAAKPRTTRGNSPARALRRDGQLPAVIYGPGKETVAVKVSVYDLEQVIKKTKTLQVFVNLAIEGQSTRTAMLKELQRHPVSGNFIHADFYEVAMDRKINVMIPIVTVGQSKGVEVGGVLQVIRHEVEAYCIPSNIPEVIEIDITDLDIGESVHVEDIEVEGDVELVHDVNFTILTVLSIRKADEEEAEEGEEVEGEGEGEAEAEEGAEEPAAES